MILKGFSVTLVRVQKIETAEQQNCAALRACKWRSEPPGPEDDDLI
jgi:hypothetical protein